MNRLKCIWTVDTAAELTTIIAPPYWSAELLMNVLLFTVAPNGALPPCPLIDIAPPSALLVGLFTLLPVKVELVTFSVP